MSPKSIAAMARLTSPLPLFVLGHRLAGRQRGHHQVPDDDERRRGGVGRHDAGDRREEHRQQEQHADDDADHAGAPALGDAGAGLDVGRGRRGRRRAAGDGRERVDEQQAVELLEVALVVEVAGLLADADERAHRVEEVATA